MTLECAGDDRNDLRVVAMYAAGDAGWDACVDGSRLFAQSWREGVPFRWWMRLLYGFDERQDPWCACYGRSGCCRDVLYDTPMCSEATPVPWPPPSILAFMLSFPSGASELRALGLVPASPASPKRGAAPPRVGERLLFRFTRARIPFPRDPTKWQQTKDAGVLLELRDGVRPDGRHGRCWQPYHTTFSEFGH